MHADDRIRIIRPQFIFVKPIRLLKQRQRLLKLTNIFVVLSEIAYGADRVSMIGSKQGLLSSMYLFKEGNGLFELTIFPVSHRKIDHAFECMQMISAKLSPARL